MIRARDTWLACIALVVICCAMVIRCAMFICCAAAAGAEPTAAKEATDHREDFNRDVRPILSAHCFKCHGPDAKARQAGLRLDQRAGATATLDSGATAVVPGKPDDSELVRRVFAADEGVRMPPAAVNKPLTPAQMQVLRRWIARGADYQPHWAFVPPTQPRLPKVKQADWPKNAIDYYVLARLEAAGLSPSPPADPYTLVRRLYLDLIGLPPTPEEVDQFLQECGIRTSELGIPPKASVEASAGQASVEASARRAAQSDSAFRIPNSALEKLVDRLLASPHYGERWARRWLDLARYADTNGYEKDRARSIWPYRDWVIAALNADLPFDRFTIEQIAGDMLPDDGDPRKTLNRRIATGFHRNTMLNEEGGIDPLEFRYHAVVDRINTTATVWLGLTLGCAQCHTHKFDPIPHQDYYRLLAFLNNGDEPEIDVPQPDIARQRAQIEQQIAALESKLATRLPSETLESQFSAWVASQSKQAARWTLLKPTAATSGIPTLTIQDDGSILASGDQSKRDVYEVTLDPAGLKGITAIRLEVLPDPRLPKHGPGRVSYEGPSGDFWLSEITLAPRLLQAAGVLATEPSAAKLTSATQSHAAGKYTASAAIDGDPQTGWSINGGQGRAHSANFRLEKPLDPAAALQLRLLFEKYYAAGLGRFRVWATTDPRGGLSAELPIEIENLLATPEKDRTPPQRERLLKHFPSVAPELAAARAEIDKLRAAVPAYPTTLVMAERPGSERRATHVHHRGEFLQLREPVQPEVLSLFAPLPQGTPRDRLSFARWLVDPANPLVGRVTMNRQWAAFFGRGLVRTTEDFGYQGQPPTHPELLDWLAVELPRQGWSLKQMHRLIVLSATYQQLSHVTPDHLRKDPENRLLARMPRVRLEAELVRDAVLRMSGLLTTRLGGPSVFPPQPPGITSEGTYGPLAWQVSEGADRYRRGLYTFAKRTAPYAMFGTFDAPSGEACVARREVSNTPLQALTLLNDAVLTEAAQTLGAQLAADSRSTPERIAYLFRRCITRPPTDHERRLLMKFHEAQLARLHRKELDADRIAGPGAGDAVHRAAWTLTARAVLNLDEVITKD